MLDKIYSFKKERERFATRWKMEVAGDKEEKEGREGALGTGPRQAPGSKP